MVHRHSIRITTINFPEYNEPNASPAFANFTGELAQCITQRDLASRAQRLLARVQDTNTSGRIDLNDSIEFFSADKAMEILATEALDKGREADAVRKLVQYMNRFFGCVLYNGDFVVICKADYDAQDRRVRIDYKKSRDFEKMLQNRKWEFVTVSETTGKEKSKSMSIAEIWLNHPERREYTHVVFNPHPGWHECKFNLL